MDRRALLLHALLLSSVAGAPAFAAEPVKVGALLSYSGVYASIGEEITNALELTLSEAGNAPSPINVLVMG